MSALNTAENLVSIKNVYSNIIETSFKIGLKKYYFQLNYLKSFQL